MPIKEMITDILQQNIPKYLKLTYSEVKLHMEDSSAITEIIDFSFNEKETWAQLELNPFRKFCESGESVIEAAFTISNGYIEIACCLYYPEKRQPYAERDGVL